MSLLQVESLSKAFAGLHAVEDVSIQLEEREFLGIIGPLSDVVASTLRNPPPFLDFLQGTAGLDVALYAVILIAIVLFLPKGVFGSVRDRWWRR